MSAPSGSSRSSIAESLAPGGPVARRLAGFELRPQQIAMAEAVASTMEDRARLLVEAGTGVGKSFAYLLPAIRRIVEHRERVVVCTHTIALQEQLVQKDIPLLQSLFGDFSAVLVKGRGNYVSLRRLAQASEKQAKLFAHEGAMHALHAVEEWAMTTNDGTRASLRVMPPSDVWDAVRSDSENCMGRKCPTYEKCFYQAARRRMEHSDLLICNHAIFFADLALRGEERGFLPRYDHVILDEAHTVEDVAAESFGARVSEGMVEHLFRMLISDRSLRGFLPSLDLPPAGDAAVGKAIDTVDEGRKAAAVFFDGLARMHDARSDRNGRILPGDVIEDPLSPVLERLAKLLTLIGEHATREGDRFEASGYASRASELASAARGFANLSFESAVGWIEVLASRSGGGSGSGGRGRVSLCAAPIDVAPLLRTTLFSGKHSVTLTSATLTTAPEDFRHPIERLGCDEARTLQLGSPFDFAAQMTVFVEADLPDPGDPQYIATMVPRLLDHIEATDGGAFVLFTSFRMLGDVVRRVRPLLVSEGFPLLVHGEAEDRTAMVDRFRRDERSVLFGTASFWQGVDVRGRALRNVIIVRLPFEVPDRPLVQARNELVEKRGGNPFRDESLPRAIIRFKQGIGRLIRSAEDSGRVVILDPRFVTRFYGRLFRAALPPGVRVEVRRAEG